jgi:uncharacterized protein
MMKNTILTALALAALPLLVLSRPASAAKAEAIDNAGFFSPDAVRQANQKLADIDGKYGKQMRVETFAEIPADLRRQFDPANARQFFQTWARQRAQAAGIEGVFVLICKNPTQIQVEVGKNTLASGVFTLDDRRRMADALLGAFRQKNYDAGLLSAVDLFESTLEKHESGSAAGAPAVTPNTGSAPPPPAAVPSPSTPRPYNLPSPTGSRPSGGFPFGGIVIFGIIIFIVIAVVRRLFRGGGGAASPSMYNRGYGAGGYPPGSGGYGGGGGGFGRGFGGGILGGLLGGWLGNQMSRRYDDSGSAHAAPPPPPADTGGGFSEPSSSDFSGGGGDALGGGGDFGGGGGGGGGGDFSGGGGGDADSGGGSF